jgi:hypothetical protein
VDFARGATDTAYSLYMDNALLHQGTFVLTDPRGMNAVELEQSGESFPSATAFATIDNLSVVPEPGSAVLACSARRRSSGGGRRCVQASAAI